VARYVPTCILRTVTDYFPSSKMERARNTERIATSVAKSLIDSKVVALNEGKGSRDVMSLLGMFCPLAVVVRVCTHRCNCRSQSECVGKRKHTLKYRRNAFPNANGDVCRPRDNCKHPLLDIIGAR